MAGTKRSTEWRKFEELVALIEHHLCPKGAVVTSPDRVRDRITGELREVDASIRYQVGSIPLLITLECRRRSAKQDVTWIEQIVRKRDDIGASATVAVSVSAFSQPALAKARFHGIETRLLQDVDGETIRNWAQNIDVVLVHGSFGLGRLHLRFTQAPGEPSPTLHPDVKAEYEKGDVEYKFIRRIEDETLISLADLLRQADREAGNPTYERPDSDVTVQVPPSSSAMIPFSNQFPGLFKEVPIGEEPVTKVYAWDFGSNEATIETDRGPEVIEHLAVEIRIVKRAYPSNVGRLLAYQSDRGLIVNIDERHLQTSEGESIRVVVSGMPDTQSNVGQ